MLLIFINAIMNEHDHHENLRLKKAFSAFGLPVRRSCASVTSL
jgi:hypothetical protein